MSDRWISIHKQLPQHGDHIEGKSPTGTWKETWDNNEPLGNMTHWRPLTSSRPHTTSFWTVDSNGWIDNVMENKK